MGFWQPPGSKPVGTGAMLRHGLALAPFVLGPAATRRLLEVVDAVERGRHGAQAGEPAWYLNNMAVRKECRGSGIGSRLLGSQLRELVDPSGAPAVLSTQRPENVTFYARFGFEVASEDVMGSGPLAFRSWTLLRRPAA